MKIAIIAAMEEEIVALSAALEGPSTRTLCGQPLLDGRLGGHEIIVTDCGIGKVNAARTAQLLIDHEAPELIINCGIAGALSTALRPFDLVIGAQLVYHDILDEILTARRPFASQFASDVDLRELAQTVYEREVAVGDWAGLGCVMGRIASGDQFINDAATRDEIAARTGAVAVDMESAAIAHVCHMAQLPCLILRQISDMADADADEVFDRNKYDAAAIVARLIVRLCAALPA